MNKIATENLFLLEFLVDNVEIDEKCECSAPPGETCVSFQFLDNAPLDVCEADFSPRRTIKNDKEQIKSGKSCLFSLSPEQATKATVEFDIFVKVVKKMLPGWLPDRVEVGVAVISVANLFVELVKSIDTSKEGCTPTAKTLKDLFDINSNTGTVVGKISVYIRMSCFGKLIVTQFQMNLDDKSVLFKDKEGKSLYRYKKAGRKSGSRSGGVDGMDPMSGYNSSCPTTPCGRSGVYGSGGMQPQTGGMGGYNSSCPTTPCGGGSSGPNGNFNPGGVSFGPAGNFGTAVGPGMVPGMDPMGQQSQPSSAGYNCPFSPCIMDGKNPQASGGGQKQSQGTNSPCSECGGDRNAACAPTPQGGMGMMGMGMMGMGMMGMGGYPAGPPGLPGMGMGFPGAGGAPMSPCAECGSPAPCITPPGMSMAMTPIGRGGGTADTPCNECQFSSNPTCGTSGQSGPPPGNYQEIGASMGGNSLTIRVHKDEGNIEQVDDSCTCSGGAGGGNKQMQSFQMSPGVPQGNKNQPFAFRMGKAGHAGDGNVVINPPVCVTPDGGQFTEFADPNKETFILRIGKKSEGADKKNNLELELCTPKGPPLKPLPKFETRDTQFDPLDIGDGGKGKKGKKGKGDKKGKGKGGKKGGKKKK